MKLTKTWSWIALTIIFSGCFTSCDLVRKMIERIDFPGALTNARPVVDSLTKVAGRGLATGVGDSAKRITRELISGLKGVTDTLDPDIKRLMITIDNVGKSISDTQLVKISKSIDSLIANAKTGIKDKSLESFLNDMLTKLLKTANKKTASLLSHMITVTLDSLNTPSSKEKITNLFSTILNDSTKMTTQRFLSAALQPSIDSIAAKVNGIVHENLPFVKRQAVGLLIGLGVISAGIIAFVWWQRRRYARLLEILTLHIDKIPSKEVYDGLTQDIKKQTQSENLEGLLRDTLAKQKINTTT